MECRGSPHLFINPFLQLRTFARPIGLFLLFFSASVTYLSIAFHAPDLPYSLTMSDQNLLGISTTNKDAINSSSTPTPTSPLVSSQATRTVAIIKPHAVDHRFEIEHRITEAKFEVRQLIINCSVAQVDSMMFPRCRF
jgi:hypothetical protein